MKKCGPNDGIPVRCSIECGLFSDLKRVWRQLVSYFLKENQIGNAEGANLEAISEGENPRRWCDERAEVRRSELLAHVAKKWVPGFRKKSYVKKERKRAT
ncbi:hypothetical protein [Roseibium sp. M-1]